MIVIQKDSFIELLQKRGYSLEEVMPCILYQHSNNNWTIDEKNIFFPRPKHMSHEQYLDFLKENTI